MEKRKVKTFMDTLMANKEFREKFDQEYQNLCISEDTDLSWERQDALLARCDRELKLIDQRKK
jgi:hypothetical protein